MAWDNGHTLTLKPVSGVAPFKVDLLSSALKDRAVGVLSVDDTIYLTTSPQTADSIEVRDFKGAAYSCHVAMPTVSHPAVARC